MEIFHTEKNFGPYDFKQMQTCYTILFPKTQSVLFYLDAMKKEHLGLIVAVFAVDNLNCSLINGHWENGCDLGFLFK